MHKAIMISVYIVFFSIGVAAQNFEIDEMSFDKSEYSSDENIIVSYNIDASGEGVVYGNVEASVEDNQNSKSTAISGGLTHSSDLSLNTPDSLGNYQVELQAYADNQAQPDSQSKDIEVSEVVGEDIEADIGEVIEVSVGDTVVFGPENQNELSIEFIRERENRDFQDMGIMPGIGSGTVTDDPLRIIFPDGRDHGGMTDVQFETGNFDVEVEDHSVSEQTATIKLVPRYSQSSDFNCENYNLVENQYAFCSNSDEDSERGAVQEVDLGHTTETFNYVRNAEVTGERYATTGVNHLFYNPDSERTLQFWQQEDSTYKGAGIEIVEWRGLSEEFDGRNMQAIVEVKPAAEPDASLDFGKNNYETGEEINLNFEAFEPGKYELKVSGAGQDTTESYGESTTEDTLSFEASEEGDINAELIAPGSWWNPLNSDQTVATASSQVKKPYSEVNHEFGEKFTISEGETTQIEGKDFYMRTLVGNSENGYPSILWRSSDEANSNSALTFLTKVESMGVQYNDDSFNPYGVVCSINPDSDSAEIVIKEERFNPWEGCDRHPDELRDQNKYEMKDYELGERISIKPGEGLEFGESTLYLKEITASDGLIMIDGNSEWVRKEPITDFTIVNDVSDDVNYTTTATFYEGEMSIGACKVDTNGAEIVMERTSETSSEWPEAWCEERDEEDEAIASIEQGSVETQGSETTFSMTVESSEADGTFSAYWETRNGERLALIENVEITPGETKTFKETVENEDINTTSSETIAANFGGKTIKDIGTLQLEESNNNTDSESNGGISLDIQKERFDLNEKIVIKATVTETVARNAYKIEVSGPETHSETFETTEAETSFTPKTAGEYTAEITPNEGLLSQIGGILTGSNTEALAETTFTVTNPDIPRWEQYCSNQDYKTDSITEKISCIEQEIIPSYFEDSSGENPEIAQSLCNNLLGYNYNGEENRCTN